VGPAFFIGHPVSRMPRHSRRAEATAQKLFRDGDAGSSRAYRTKVDVQYLSRIEPCQIFNHNQRALGNLWSTMKA
jgi:hypothetical protein